MHRPREGTFATKRVQPQEKLEALPDVILTAVQPAKRSNDRGRQESNTGWRTGTLPAGSFRLHITRISGNTESIKENNMS